MESDRRDPGLAELTGAAVKEEREITVETALPLRELEARLRSRGFAPVERFTMVDRYMLPGDADRSQEPLQILGRCLLLRHILEERGERRLLVYKKKLYNDRREILWEGKAECEVVSLKDAEALLTAMGYELLITVHDCCRVWSDGAHALAVQEVNGKRLYIELEERRPDGSRYGSIEEMKAVIDSCGIPVRNGEYYAKKAENELLEAANAVNECHE